MKSSKFKVLHKIDIATGIIVWVSFVISSVICYYTKNVQACEFAKALAMVICFQAIAGIIIGSVCNAVYGKGFTSAAMPESMAFTFRSITYIAVLVAVTFISVFGIWRN